MRTQTICNDDWRFIDNFTPDMVGQPGIGCRISLPHNAVNIPLNYFDEDSWQKKFGYQKTIEWQSSFDGKEVSLAFDGVMANAKVYLGRDLVGTHHDGFTPFEVPLRLSHVQERNLVSVVIDGMENPEIPPFGGRIDYLTYAGIYRDVWLKVIDPIAIDQVKVEPFNTLDEHKSIAVWCRLKGHKEHNSPIDVTCQVIDPDTDRIIGKVNATCTADQVRLTIASLASVKLWDIDDPKLYILQTSIECDGSTDCIETNFGFRTAEFKSDGFYLNGRKLKIRGLNRHQSFPYVGYAMGRIAQERDAEMLKHDLGCNLVRTSHYPQSPWFHDHCDRIGLLVFEEIPGWQHIGGPKWKNRVLQNVESMIRRNWNRPSNILWGVRINESEDDQALYMQTNALARKLDPTRQTGGVRFITDSEFLEDVYTMNDFVQGSEELWGANHQRVSLRDQRDVTGLKHAVPYLVTEFNGHMFPTKRTDSEHRQVEHVVRYLDILNKANGDPNISGCIGWCFADYNTHKDFGSGDHICHHGVMDMFRIPKFASYVYSSQKDPAREIVLKPVTCWARGERNIGGVLPLYILTNCDKVIMEYGRHLVKTAYPDRNRYPCLDHPPVIFDHTQFEPEEMGRWGLDWDDVIFIGYLGSKVVKTVSMAAKPVATQIDVRSDWKKTEFDQIEQVRFEVKALDQFGNIMPYFDDPLSIHTDGGEIIGPDCLAMRGGVAGFWVNVTRSLHQITVSAYTHRLPSKTVIIDLAQSPATH